MAKVFYSTHSTYVYSVYYCLLTSTPPMSCQPCYNEWYNQTTVPLVQLPGVIKTILPIGDQVTMSLQIYQVVTRLQAYEQGINW